MITKDMRLRALLKCMDKGSLKKVFTIKMFIFWGVWDPKNPKFGVWPNFPKTHYLAHILMITNDMRLTEGFLEVYGQG